MIHVFIRLIYLSAALCTALYVLLCVFPCLAIKVPHRALYAVVLLSVYLRQLFYVDPAEGAA